MAKKTKADKKAAAKTKTKKREQLKIPGTQRQSIPEIEDADTEYREARDAWQELHGEMLEAQGNLTAALKEHGLESHVYEGKDGREYEAYLPEVEEPQAKSRVLKKPKAQAQAAE